MVVCLERGADLHMAELMPPPLTVSCFSKIQIGFTFLVPAHPGSPERRAVKRVCVCFNDFLIFLKYKIKNGDPNQYFLLYKTLATENAVTLTFYMFGRLTCERNTEKLKIRSKVELWEHVYRPLCQWLGSNLACASKPTVYCFMPNFSMIGT